VEAKLICDLAAEAKARTDYDAKLVASIASETASRQSVDIKLPNDLAFEVARATAQELSVLWSNFGRRKKSH
jgi:hypothetical protein